MDFIGAKQPLQITLSVRIYACMSIFMFVCKALEFSMILVYVHSLVPLEYTSPLIGAWKCNLPPFQEIMSDRRPTKRRTEGLIGM